MKHMKSKLVCAFIVLLLCCGCVSLSVMDNIYPVGLVNESDYIVNYQVFYGSELVTAGGLFPNSAQLVRLPYGNYTVDIVYFPMGVSSTLQTNVLPEDYANEGEIPSFVFGGPVLPESEGDDTPPDDNLKT